jgi:hypothetical protein
MDKYPAGQLGGHMDLTGQVLDESSLEHANETSEERETAGEITDEPVTTGMTTASELNVGALGIASVLFPATPPSPLNARLIRGLSFHDDSKKPRGLAGAAGIFQSIWDLPDDAADAHPSDTGWT